MPACFFDTSGVAKRYVQEAGSAWVSRFFHPYSRNTIWITRLAAVEVVSAIVRRGRGGSLSPSEVGGAIAQFHRELAVNYHWVPITPRLFEAAMRLAAQHALRGSDAVQLAAAQRLNRHRLGRRLSPIILISADADLNAAALVEGLRVDDPNSHP